jgi:outer membrane protein assembly factor BamB
MPDLNSVIMKGAIGSLPSASIPGRLYFATDTLVIMRDNGTTWDDVTPGSATVSVHFAIPNGTVGTGVALLDEAPRSGAVSKCVVIVTASDATVGLSFRIKKNGTDVFSTDPTVAAATASGTIITLTTLTSTPLPIAAGDVFSIDILTGSQSWQFTTKLL